MEDTMLVRYLVAVRRWLLGNSRVISEVEWHVVCADTKGVDENLNKPSLAIHTAGAFEQRDDIIRAIQDGHTAIEELYFNRRIRSIAGPTLL
jgi:hypothetical protein